MAALAYAEEAGAGGLLYAVGADCRVVALETGAGAQVLRFRAGKHPLRAAAASPGDPLGQGSVLPLCEQGALLSVAVAAAVVHRVHKGMQGALMLLVMAP